MRNLVTKCTQGSKGEKQKRLAIRRGQKKILKVQWISIVNKKKKKTLISLLSGLSFVVSINPSEETFLYAVKETHKAKFAIVLKLL